MSEEVRQCFICKRAINWLLSHATVMSQRVQRSLQLANIATHLVREVAKDFLRCDRLSQANCPGAQDGQPGLRFGGAMPHTAPPKRRSVISAVNSSARRGWQSHVTTTC